jgi:hypothetical protein
MTGAQHKAAIIKIMRSVAHRHDLYRVFADSIEMIALAISNRVDMAQYEAREARYMEAIKPYNRDELMQIAHILPHLTGAFEDQHSDYLGEIFMELDLGSDARGQFFTPFGLSKLTAGLNIDDGINQRIAERGFVTVAEPAVGSGGMVIALADVMRERGLNYQDSCHATCMDVDIKAVHMAYIQLSLIGLPAVIVHGNTLTLDEWSHWHTPFHVFGGWERRLREPRQPAPVPTIPPHDAEDIEPIDTPAGYTVGQMELFA